MRTSVASHIKPIREVSWDGYRKNIVGEQVHKQLSETDFGFRMGGLINRDSESQWTAKSKVL